MIYVQLLYPASLLPGMEGLTPHRHCPLKIFVRNCRGIETFVFRRSSDQITDGSLSLHLTVFF